MPYKDTKHKSGKTFPYNSTGGRTADELFQLKFGSKFTKPSEAKASRVSDAQKGKKHKVKYYKRKGNTEGNTPEELFQKKMAKEKNSKLLKPELKTKATDLIFKDFLLGHDFIQYCKGIAAKNTSTEFRDALSSLANRAEQESNLPLMKASLVLMGLFDKSYTSNLSRTNTAIVKAYENWITKVNPGEVEFELEERMEEIISQGLADEFVALMNMQMSDFERKKVNEISMKIIQDVASAKMIKAMIDNLHLDLDGEDSDQALLYNSLVKNLEQKEAQVRQEISEILDHEEVNFDELNIFFNQDYYDIKFTIGVFNEYMTKKGWSSDAIISMAKECEYNYLYYVLIQDGANNVQDKISAKDYKSVEDFLKVADINSEVVNEAIIFLDITYLIELSNEIDAESYPLLAKLIKNDIEERKESIGQYLNLQEGIDLHELEIALEKSEGNKYLILQHLLDIQPNLLDSMFKASETFELVKMKSVISEYQEMKKEAMQSAQVELESPESSFARGSKHRLSTKSDTSLDDSAVGDSDYFGSEESGSEESASEPTTPTIGYDGLGQMGLSSIEAY